MATGFRTYKKDSHLRRWNKWRATKEDDSSTPFNGDLRKRITLRPLSVSHSSESQGSVWFHKLPSTHTDHTFSFPFFYVRRRVPNGLFIIIILLILHLACSSVRCSFRKFSFQYFFKHRKRNSSVLWFRRYAILGTGIEKFMRTNCHSGSSWTNRSLDAVDQDGTKG